MRVCFPGLLGRWDQRRSSGRALLPILFLLLAGLAPGWGGRAAAGEVKTRNVILVTADGLRWEEVFRGAEEMLMSRAYGNVADTNALRARFWRPTVEERRAALFPFLWGTVAKQGQLWGNRDLGSAVRVGNGHHFSYPGYNEFLTGAPDARISSNDKVLNERTNVFEWLNHRPGFRGKVAAVVNWDVLPWTLNAPRAGFPVWSAFEVPPGTVRLPGPDRVDAMAGRSQTIWSGVLLDVFVHEVARHTLRTRRPRALWVSCGETDDWAHDGYYDRYLKAAQALDRFLGELWGWCQSVPQYRGRTSLVITVDHGRGPAPVAWKNHGRELADSAYIWLGVLGPDTPALGERRDTPLVTQGQVAATVAALAGEDFHRAGAGVLPPIPGVAAAPR